MQYPSYTHEYLEPRIRDFLEFRKSLRNEGYAFTPEVEAILYREFRRVKP